MKHVVSRIALVFCATFFSILSNGQNLSPKDLQKVHSSSDPSTITTLLVERGFKKSEARNGIALVTEERWYFQPFTNFDDQIISYLIKTVDSFQTSKTVFLLYNQFHYKAFIKSLTDARYKFQGVEFIDGNTSYVFKNKRFRFALTEKSNAGRTKHAEIVLETNK